MVNIRSIGSALFVAATAVTASPIEKRAMTAAEVQSSIEEITDLSRQLQPVASSIQTGQTAIGKRQFSNPFEPVITGFQQIIRTASDDISQMDGTPEFAEAEAQPICDAFSTFVTVHQELLNIMIGKSGLLEGIFLGPVAAVLRGLENTVDTLAFGIIDSVPTCETMATQKKRNLDDTLGKAICAYTPGGSLGLDLFC